MAERWGGWRFTRHALERMAEMGIRHQQVLEVLRQPEVDRPATRDRKGAEHPGRRMAQRERYSVVYDGWFVITVLYWTQEEYQRPER